MPTLAPDVLASIEALTDWLSRPETKERLGKVALDSDGEILSGISL